MKSELQEKNAKLSDALTKAREDLKSAERDRTLLEDEKKRIQTQLTNAQHQASSNEAALQLASQVISTTNTTANVIVSVMGINYSKSSLTTITFSVTY